VDLENEMETVEAYIPAAPKTNLTVDSTEASHRITAIEEELARLNQDLAIRRLQHGHIKTL
jgi:hypothetical protein